MKVERKTNKDMLAALLQCTLEDRQRVARLNIIAWVWTIIIHWQSDKSLSQGPKERLDP